VSLALESSRAASIVCRKVACSQEDFDCRTKKMSLQKKKEKMKKLNVQSETKSILKSEEFC